MSTAKAAPQFPYLVGFESIFDQLNRNARKVGYPPHNVIKNDEAEYTIELAVAGFTMEDLSIVLEDHTLVVEGDKEEDREVEYIYKGLSARSFVKRFDLAENVQVVGAHLVSGILSIELEVVTSTQDPIEIEIQGEV